MQERAASCALGRAVAAGDAIPAGDNPAMSTILQQGLGLQLRAQKVSLPVIVIDSAEPPSPN